MRVVRLSPAEMEEYIENLSTQSKNIKKTLYELVIYSNGSLTLEDLYSISFEEIIPIEKILTEKIKSDRNIQGKEYL
jgi:hypothetical protein